MTIGTGRVAGARRAALRFHPDPDPGRAVYGALPHGVEYGYLADRRRLPTGEIVPAVGAFVPGTIVAAPRSATSVDAVALTADGDALRVFVDASMPAAPNASDPVPGAVFVYGTLRAGEERHDVMRGHRPVRSTAARVTGAELVDLGEYPGLVLVGRERGRSVAGEAYFYDDVRALLVELDAIEDFFGYDAREGSGPSFCAAGSLYRRSLIDVTAHGVGLAWVYVYVGEVGDAPLVPGGDWLLRG